ncbi:MAG: PHP domain-containing protein [Prochlorothrix sp.]
MTASLPQPRSPNLTPAARHLAAVFATIVPTSCPAHYNFHLHTRWSDGQMQPLQLLDQAIEVGLMGLAITDHHTLEGYREAQDYHDNYRQALPEPTDLPQLWSGIEITAELLDTAVHILGYGFATDHPALAPYSSELEMHPSGQPFLAAEVIDVLHEAGGLAVLAHPVRYRKPPEALIPAAVDLGIDGVETFYAYDNPVPWRPSLEQTERVQHLSQLYGLLQTCGTDSHGSSLLQRL